MTTAGNSFESIGYTLDGTWRFQSEVMRQFLDTDEDYAALCREVVYLVSRSLTDHSVEVAGITWRCKTLQSFLEKVQRKSYVRPFLDITDRAGVRVICNYKSDCARVADIIESTFEVFESEDKLVDLGADRFGYGAHHLLIRLKPDSGRVRYDRLQPLVCEIQIRSLLQDAWAVLQHQLFYKHEDRIPIELLRTVNSLSALLENADNGFASLRAEHSAHISKVRESRTDSTRFLMNELTADSFGAYLRWKFPERPVERSEGQVRRIVADLDHHLFRLLSDIDGAIEEFSDEIRSVGSIVDTIDLHQDERRPSAFDAVWAAAFRDSRMLAGTGLPLHWRDALRLVLDAGPHKGL